MPSLAALAAERDAIRLAVLTAPTWKLQTRWLGRQWARLLAIEAELGRRAPPKHGWP